MHKTLQWLLKIAVSVAFLYAVLQFVDTNLLAAHLKDMQWQYVPIVLVLLIVSMGFRAWRFTLLFNSAKHRMSLLDSFNLGMIGETLNMILPGATGDIAKAYYGYKQHKVKEEMISATVLDKMIALLGLVLLGLAAAIAYTFWVFFAVFALCSLLLAIFIFFPCFIPWNWFAALQKRLKKNVFDISLLEQSFSASFRLKMYATIVSVIGWLSSFVMLFFITKLFGLDISLLFLCMVAPLINLSKLFPLSWSGLGVQEGVTAYLFGLVGISVSASVLVSLVYTITATLLPGLVGLGLILYWKERK